MTRPLSAATLVGLLAAAGCGGRTTDVSGTVTFKGKPVVYGTVVFFGPDGLSKSGVLKPDGTYTVVGVPVGACKVAVSSPPPQEVLIPSTKKGRGGRDEDDERIPPPPTISTDPAVTKGWVPLPEKFGDPDKSGLTADVQPGKPADFDLK
jgi:hypothetical protein